MVDCPICRRPAAPRADNPSFPFCGARCKSIDLGKWLLEDYRVHTDEPADDVAGAAAAASSEAE